MSAIPAEAAPHPSTHSSIFGVLARVLGAIFQSYGATFAALAEYDRKSAAKGTNRQRTFVR